MRERPLFRRHTILGVGDYGLYYAVYDHLDDGRLICFEATMAKSKKVPLWVFRTMRKRALEKINKKKEMFKLSGV